MPDDLVRSLWLNRLPSVAQAILAAHIDADLDTVANIADTVVEAVTHHQVSQVSTVQEAEQKHCYKISSQA